MLANRGRTQHADSSLHREYAIIPKRLQVALQVFDKPLENIVCSCVSVTANRAAEGAQARVHEAGGAAKRSEEKYHYFGKKTGI